MNEIYSIIDDLLTENYGNSIAMDLQNYFNTDEMVDYCRSTFFDGCDGDDIKDTLGEEEGQIFIDYYNLHCASDKSDEL